MYQKIIYLDFETTVVGYFHEGFETNIRRIESPIPSQNLPVAAINRYKHVPFLPRDLDTTTFEYIQTVNHCDAQYENGSVFNYV